MIRQTITREQYDKITDSEFAELGKLLNYENQDRDKWYFMSKLTIGVLQGLLLDAGYNVSIGNDTSGDDEKYPLVVTTLRKSFVAETLIVDFYNEPIDVLLEAVLTLVIGEENNGNF